MNYKSIDYDFDLKVDNLLDIYLWKPESSSDAERILQFRGSEVRDTRKRVYKKPNSTERTGIITSRVGQGYYRQQILDKWNKKCPITGCDVEKILIASHILKWSDSSAKERLDVDNGILLSPNVDALFDRHLISFSNEGYIILSKRFTKLDLKRLGINEGQQISVNNGMRKYLEHHRTEMYNKYG